MSTSVPNDIFEQLNQFSRTVWGNAQAVLKTVESSPGVEYIDLAGYRSAFVFLLGRAVRDDKILVREEYRIASQALQTGAYSEGAYVTGHPGIGKTLFLVYLLLQLLGQKCVVAVQLMVNDTGLYGLFQGGHVTFHSLDHDVAPLRHSGATWALADSNAERRHPSNVFYARMEGIRTIQATSPRSDRWKEWSKQSGAECYVMNFWSVQEIADLAKLLELDDKRMTFLAMQWGCIPRRLLRFMRMEDRRIEEEYVEDAEVAVQKCRSSISAAIRKNLVEDGPSKFFFCQPKREEGGVVRTLCRACVPTPTLRRLLGEALQQQDNTVKLDFFLALSQSNETRQAAGYIYESWFHSYFSAAKPIQCNWVQGFNGVSSLTGTTTLIPATWSAVKVAEPPYYWVAPKNFVGIDSALVLEQEIYAFQVTISSKHKSPKDGMATLRNHLPTDLKKLPWRVVFVGDDDNAIWSVASDWVGKLFSPTDGASVPIAWCGSLPVAKDVTYKVFHDESDPDVESDEASMEVGE